MVLKDLCLLWTKVHQQQKKIKRGKKNKKEGWSFLGDCDISFLCSATAHTKIKGFLWQVVVFLHSYLLIPHTLSLVLLTQTKLSIKRGRRHTQCWGTQPRYFFYLLFYWPLNMYIHVFHISLLAHHCNLWVISLWVAWTQTLAKRRTAKACFLFFILAYKIKPIEQIESLTSGPKGNASNCFVIQVVGPLN